MPKLRLRLSHPVVLGPGVSSRKTETSLVESLVSAAIFLSFAEGSGSLSIDWPQPGQKKLDAGTFSPQPEQGEGGVTDRASKRLISLRVHSKSPLTGLPHESTPHGLML